MNACIRRQAAALDAEEGATGDAKARLGRLSSRLLLRYSVMV
jgi:hypothetical protein